MHDKDGEIVANPTELNLYQLCHFKRAQFIFSVRASDRGEPPLHADVEVELVVVDRNNKPPIWDNQNYGPIYVKENATPGHTVTSVKARFVLGLRVFGEIKSTEELEFRYFRYSTNIERAWHW